MASTEDDRSGRRLVGLDRSGPKPRETRRGQPLRPLTIPNLVGYLRLAGIPVFLYLALSSDDGQTAGFHARHSHHRVPGGAQGHHVKVRREQRSGELRSGVPAHGGDQQHLRP